MLSSRREGVSRPAARSTHWTLFLNESVQFCVFDTVYFLVCWDIANRACERSGSGRNFAHAHTSFCNPRSPLHSRSHDLPLRFRSTVFFQVPLPIRFGSSNFWAGFAQLSVPAPLTYFIVQFFGPPGTVCVLRIDVLVLGCMNATTTLGQRNVYVSCELRARPDVVQLYWVIDDNGTTVSETQVVDEYWTLLMVMLSSSLL